MKTRAIVWSFKLIAACWVFSATPVGASDASMVFGERFNVGGVELRVGYGQSWLQGPTYYFESRTPLADHGHDCSEYCIHIGDIDYHHKSCPVVRRLFATHGFSTDYLVGTFGPSLGVGYSKPEGHRSSYRGFSNSYGVPPEQIASVGSCRVWFPDRPLGHQPPPVDCLTARQTAPSDAYVIYDGPVYRGH